MPGSSPTVRRRRLAAELLRLRKAAGKTMEEAGTLLECAPSKIARMESPNGGGVKLRDIRDLVTWYGASEEELEPLLNLARESREKGWWTAYAEALSSPYEVYVGLEAEAVSVMNFEIGLVPGLLQTEEYARAILHAYEMTDRLSAESERKLEVKTARQQRLDGPDPLRCWAIVDEAALRREVGGRSVMIDQLGHIQEIARRPHVTFQVLPYTAGAHPAMVGPFVVLGFPEQADPDVVYIDSDTGGLYLEREAEVDRYSLMFDHLRAVALSPAESVKFTTAMAKELKS